MGLTERHWFENEDAPENYEWALEDAVVSNSHTNEKYEDQKASGAWNFVCYNPNYSPFDGSPSKLYECTNCGYTTGSATKYCPVCGSKNQP